MEVTVKKQEKQISAQRFVMNNLRNGIEYLKDHCKRDRTDGQNVHNQCDQIGGNFATLVKS